MPNLTPQNLINFVVQRGSVTFTEIEDYFGSQTKGDIGELGDLIVWAKMSDRLIDVLNDDRVRNALTVYIVHPSVCQDGQMPVCFRKREPKEEMMNTFLLPGSGKSGVVQ